MIEIQQCISDPCRSRHPGHRLHEIQAELTEGSPWGWRDGVVTAVDGQWLHITYRVEQGRPRVWCHAPLGTDFPIGTPVRLHERFHVLGSPSGWLSVIIRDGLGSVQDPAEPANWTAEMTQHAVDSGSELGRPLDHHRA